MTKSLEPKNNCLRIYIQGHEGSPFDFEYHNKILNNFLKDGCDVLSMSMLGIGQNIGKVFFPIRSGTTIKSPWRVFNLRNRTNIKKNKSAVIIILNEVFKNDLLNKYLSTDISKIEIQT